MKPVHQARDLYSSQIVSYIILIIATFMGFRIDASYVKSPKIEEWTKPLSIQIALCKYYCSQYKNFSVSSRDDQARNASVLEADSSIWVTSILAVKREACDCFVEL